FPHSCPQHSRGVQTVTPVTPLESALTQTAGSHPSSQLAFHYDVFVNPFDATLMGQPRKRWQTKDLWKCKVVAKPFRCNTYKKPGEGVTAPQAKIYSLSQ